MIEYIKNHLDIYLKMVDRKNWYYKDIDNELVMILFKEYAKELEINKSYGNYEDVLVNIHKFCVAKITCYFRDLHIISQSSANNIVVFNISSDLFNTMAENLAISYFISKAKVEKLLVKHSSEIYKRGYNAIHKNEKNNKYIKNSKEDDELLKYVTVGDENVREEHEKADGIVAPASDPIWDTLLTYLEDYNCRCQVVSVRSTTKQTSQEDIDSRDLKPTPDSPSEIDWVNKELTVFGSKCSYFLELLGIIEAYDIVTKEFEKDQKELEQSGDYEEDDVNEDEDEYDED